MLFQKMSSTLTNWYQGFKDQVARAFTGLGNLLKSPFEGLSINHAKEDKQKLEDFREHYYQKIAQEAHKEKPNYCQLAKDISGDFQNYLNKIVAEEVQKLGKPPCGFSLISLGSLARQECGPVTDLEIAFCVEDKNPTTYPYFRKLTQNLADRLFLLGEHPDLGEKGLRLDEADNAPPYLKFFARNASPKQQKEMIKQAILNREMDKIPQSGSRAFICTPSEMASFSDPEFKQNPAALRRQKQQWIEEYANKKNLSHADKQEMLYYIDELTRPFSSREKRIAMGLGTQLSRNTTHVFGDKKLYQKYLQEREKILSKKQPNGLSNRQAIARTKLLKEDISNHIQKGTSIFLEGKLGKTLDIKREFYRFAEQFVTNLGFYYKTDSQNTQEVVDELIKKGNLEPEFGGELKDYLNFALGLRMKKQSILKRQGFACYLSQEKFDKDKSDLEEELQGLKNTISYLENNKADASLIAQKKRNLLKLESEYAHMLDMRPGAILSPEDIQKLESKYAPLAKKIFEKAQAWVSNSQALKPAQPMMPEARPLPDKKEPLRPVGVVNANPQPSLTQQRFNQKKSELEEQIIGLKLLIANSKGRKAISQRKQALIKLENQYAHLLDSNPGSVLSSEEILNLKQKYAASSLKAAAPKKSGLVESLESVYGRLHDVKALIEHAIYKIQPPKLEALQLFNIIKQYERCAPVREQKLREAKNLLPIYQKIGNKRQAS
jgi:hypothetical protein